MSFAHISWSSMCIIGPGKMAKALLERQLPSLPEVKWHLVGKTKNQSDTLGQQFFPFPISCYEDLAKVPPCQVYVICVKPQQWPDLLPGLLQHLHSSPFDSLSFRPLVISFMAGVTHEDLSRQINADIYPDKNVDILRIMPNTPMSVGQGQLLAYTQTQDLRERWNRWSAPLGKTHWVKDESLFNALSCISGSGPAFFFELVDQMCTFLQESGVSPDQAQQIATQTFIGSAKLLESSGTSSSPKELQSQVTSKGGVTFASLQYLQSRDLGEILQKAFKCNVERSKELQKGNG